ncbi:MAG: hypothetical protein JKY96_05010 [Phycisphaerales bacterium]|nr:hypothetical protein [Phycisphaerales bacterium]
MEPNKAHAPTALFLFASLAALAISLGSGCSDSSSETEATQAPEIDSSYLDELASSREPEADEETIDSTDEPVEIAQNQIPEDEEREWVRERGSQSSLGKTRDRAKKLANELSGGTAPENGIADTYSDEEYANTSGYRWDMPEDWRMAVPSSGNFAEMYIKSDYGAASVTFSKESGTVQNIIRSLTSTLTDDMGGRSKPKQSKKTVLGMPVTVIDLVGTYIDPMSKGGKNMAPFYAMHAVIIELPNTRVLIKVWGPEDTINQSTAKFDAMIEQMIKE